MITEYVIQYGWKSNNEEWHWEDEPMHARGERPFVFFNSESQVLALSAANAMLAVCDYEEKLDTSAYLSHRLVVRTTTDEVIDDSP